MPGEEDLVDGGGDLGGEEGVAGVVEGLSGVGVETVHGMAGFVGEGESFRVTSPVLEGRYVYWLIADLRRNEQFAARTLVRRRSPLEFSDRLFPRDATSIAVALNRLYYTDPLGLFTADEPPPAFAPRG